MSFYSGKSVSRGCFQSPMMSLGSYEMIKSVLNYIQWLPVNCRGTVALLKLQRSAHSLATAFIATHLNFFSENRYSGNATGITSFPSRVPIVSVHRPQKVLLLVNPAKKWGTIPVLLNTIHYFFQFIAVTMVTFLGRLDQHTFLPSHSFLSSSLDVERSPCSLTSQLQRPLLVAEQRSCTTILMVS